MIDRATLDKVAGRKTGLVGDALVSAFDQFWPKYEITTPLRQCHFIAQAAHESGGFRYLREIWGPTKAQKGYEGRRDLGNIRTGDGFIYRGRGIFQLTGRANYARVGKALNLPLEVDPELASDPHISVEVACYYWATHHINVAADANDIVRVTKAINGGTNGLEDRKAYFMRARQVIV